MKAVPVIFFILVGAIIAKVDESITARYVYKDENMQGASMAINIDRKANTIYYRMPESQNFGEVETLEDYNVGLAASRVAAEEKCFFRKMKTTLEESYQQFMQNQNGKGELEYQGTYHLYAVPDDSPQEWASQRLIDFCDDYPIYRLVVLSSEGKDIKVNGPAASANNQEERFFFWGCSFFFFFSFNCFTTTITITTNATSTFSFFFFG